MRRSTLNARHGYYVATGLTEAEVDLTLRFKALDGTIERVGRYRLDLEELVDQDVVTRRSTPDGDVYDVKIVRDDDRSYWLSVRSAARILLDDYAIGRS